MLNDEKKSETFRDKVIRLMKGEDNIVEGMDFDPDDYDGNGFERLVSKLMMNNTQTAQVRSHLEKNKNFQAIGFIDAIHGQISNDVLVLLGDDALRKPEYLFQESSYLFPDHVKTIDNLRAIVAKSIERLDVIIKNRITLEKVLDECQIPHAIGPERMLKQLENKSPVVAWKTKPVKGQFFWERGA